MEYVTISSTGNSQDFGDLTVARRFATAASSPTRGLFIGGTSSNVIDYITIASTGNATDFGDTGGTNASPNATSSSLRAIHTRAGAYSEIIEFVTIATTGNSQDFGDLATEFNDGTGCSNVHGGLG